MEAQSYKVIAVDFDGTLFKTEYPTILEPIPGVVERAKREKANGAKLILWTCREGVELEEAVAACREQGIEFDAVNCNIPERVEAWGSDPRKVGADEYWDNRALPFLTLDAPDVAQELSLLDVLSRTTPLWGALHLIRKSRNEEAVYAALETQMAYVPADLLRVYVWQFQAIIRFLEISDLGHELDGRTVEVLRRLSGMIDAELARRSGTR